ncbi:GAF and ANTAR domain-containing protein [Amycolatopsis sp. FDAARGOS 1241]|uniref:GAF and ANTAR domain-containing protein n=1 Tax=Amycolatopsis sp. FDAARGOS 1241 TaxID=2778070 RepID=UPI0019523295|nr:GAF and ANTAR domain-containing protein [Amycolatopsis sp. FDAARGOS 1241]QRP43008.1 GAF and ANTAR domain-containing protein [Amycolatopsis sp. FDAARGOS 1241]
MTDLDRLDLVLRSIVAEGGTDSPRRIGAACVELLPVSGAAITLMTSVDAQEPVYASDVVVSQLDGLQFSLGEGPCVEAFLERRPVLIADLVEVVDGRWPLFAHAARDTPARGLFVFPLQLGAVTVGVLGLYRLEPGALAGNDLTGALRAADAAMWSLLGLREGETLETVNGTGPADVHAWLSGVPLHRTEVYQATGMIIGQLGVTAPVALAKLRGFAFAHDRPLDEVARDVVARRLQFDNEELR